MYIKASRSMEFPGCLWSQCERGCLFVSLFCFVVFLVFGFSFLLLSVLLPCLKFGSVNHVQNKIYVT